MLTTIEKKQTIWEKTAEEHLYEMLSAMGYSSERRDLFQRTRIVQSIIIFIVLIFLAILSENFFYVLAFVVPIYYYRSRLKYVQRNYQIWRFNRQLNFNKFTRLLIPYLKQSEGKIALYSIFNKMLLRIINEVDRNSLYRLMSEMSSRPNDVTSFIDFANRSSGTDNSILFMSTIFDFQQSTFDIEVINELGRMSSEELLSNIDDIIHMKLKRFENFATKITMSSFILMIGYFIIIVIEIITMILEYL